MNVYNVRYMAYNCQLNGSFWASWRYGCVEFELNVLCTEFVRGTELHSQSNVKLVLVMMADADEAISIHP